MTPLTANAAFLPTDVSNSVRAFCVAMSNVPACTERRATSNWGGPLPLAGLEFTRSSEPFATRAGQWAHFTLLRAPRGDSRRTRRAFLIRFELKVTRRKHKPLSAREARVRDACGLLGEARRTRRRAQFAA